MSSRPIPGVPFRSAPVPGRTPGAAVAAPAASTGGRVTAAGPSRARSRPAVAATFAVLEVSFLTRWAVAGAVFLAISKFHEYIGILATIRAPMLMSVVALVMLLSDVRRWRPADLGKHWIPKVLGVFVLIAFGSIPFGIYPGQSLKTFNEVLSRTLLLALMVWGVARTPKGALFMTRVFTITIITAALLALKLGRQDVTGRLAGGYAYDPNDIALLGVTGIPLVIWWVLDRRNRFRWAFLAAVPLLLQVIVRSQSRGGFLGLLAMTAGFLLIGLGPVDKRVKKAGVVVGLLLVMAIPFFPASYLTQMKTITADDDYNQTSISGRKKIWKRGVGYALERPLFGVGLGNFNSAEGRSEDSQDQAAIGRGFKWGTAHNSYVQVLAETGFFGGACFVAALIGSIIALVRMHRRGSHRDMLPPFLALSMTGFAASAFFLSWGYFDLTYALIGLACAILMRGDNAAADSSAAPIRSTAPPRSRR